MVPENEPREWELQLTLMDLGPPALDNLKDRITWVLSEYPEARNCYRTCQYYVWFHFYGLADALAGGLEEFRDWYVDPRRCPAAKTILQRAQEIQRANADLRPSKSVQRIRQEQARQGPVGTKRRY